MKLYDWKLDEISIDCDTSARLVSYQGQIFRDLFYKINLDCDICFLDPGLKDVCFNDNDIITTATNINNSNINMIVYLMCDHNWMSPTHCNLDASTHKLLSLITKPTIHIVWDYFSELTSQQIRYPIWTTMCAKRQIHQTNLSLPRKYLYSCLSNIVKPFRIINLLEFQKSAYYNKSLITFNAPTGALYNELSSYGMQYVTQFEDIIPLLPINTASSITDIALVSVVNNEVIYDYSGSAYQNTYVNIILETGYTDKFFSEKTFKPILANQFFVIIAGKGAVAVLRELGFDTYDDIIDHRRYDNSPDNTRIQDVHTLLHDMQHYNWEQIYKDTVERREKNRQLLLNLTFEKNFITELTHIIETIVKPT
jgi:hypothetical protein